MNLSFETLLLVALVGAAVGFLGRMMSGDTGLGTLGDVAAGVVGAIAGAAAAPKLGIAADTTNFAIILVALVGAVVVLLGARYLAEVWQSQRRTSAEPDAREQAPPTAAERTTLAPAADTTTNWVRRATPEPRQPREPEPRDVPQPRLWFRES
ncbi:hypothetical protein [Rhodoplanes roseus]|uniref:GlsB/YeaQ/YmgE family stress response membrane protein n=1 Tax=Rhodoplanes roseus TaxID=29409 RepID=A0A327KQA4_9BRAD|nr:hypothetical protein [Rhodoplanes roseus]RAI40066.1 hypothetical protein CH341_24545 [Rhodoplanes roseus]